jgi:hypothetical protein
VPAGIKQNSYASRRRASRLFGGRRREDDRSARHHPRMRIKSSVLVGLSSDGSAIAARIMTIKKHHSSRVSLFDHVKSPTDIARIRLVAAGKGKSAIELTGRYAPASRLPASATAQSVVTQSMVTVSGNIDSRLCAKYE